MIRLIAAIDEKRGMANDHGIPWHGKTPTDVREFRQKIQNGNVLMGLVTYKEYTAPPSHHRNLVLNDTDDPLRPGFEEVPDLPALLRDTTEDLWVIGGAGVFAETIGKADELHLTRLEGDFQCTKFFPEFEADFVRVSQSKPLTENGITYRFEVWKRHTPKA